MGLREGQIWPKSIVDVTTLAPTSQFFKLKIIITIIITIIIIIIKNLVSTKSILNVVICNLTPV
jgi:hypothetical protein